MSEELELRVVHYPEPVLRKLADDVEAFDDELRETVKGMFERMYADKGVGLAAPQVGIGRRILVINQTGDAKNKDEELALINIRITDRSGAKVRAEEGCLSFPGIYAEIERPDRCKLSAFDPDGNPLELELDGFLSRIAQHEYDHLEGVLLVDRMTPADKLGNRAALEELVEDYRERRKKLARKPS